MRELLRAAPVALALLTALSLPVRAQGVKVAYVQTSVLLDQAPGRAEAEAQFDKETGGYREQIKRMSDSLNAMVADFQKRQATLTPAARETQGKGLQAKEQEYQRRTQELEQKGQTGSSLAWFLKAQQEYPNSDFARKGVERLTKEILPDAT